MEMSVIVFVRIVNNHYVQKIMEKKERALKKYSV